MAPVFDTARHALSGYLNEGPLIGRAKPKQSVPGRAQVVSRDRGLFTAPARLDPTEARVIDVSFDVRTSLRDYSRSVGRRHACLHARVGLGENAAGTPYAASYDKAPSPTCGYRYTRTSANEPGRAYTVAVTANWQIEWSGGGQSGVIPMSLARTTQLRVGEIQVIVNGSGQGKP